MANQYQSVDPTLVALQGAKRVSPQVKKPVPAMSTTGTPLKPSLNPISQQPQAIPITLGGLPSPFGAKNINQTPNIGASTPQQIGQTQSQLNSLPKQIPATGTPDRYISKEKMKEVLQGLPDQNERSQTLDHLVSKGYTIQGYNDEGQQTPMQGGVKGFVNRTVNSIAQPFKTMGSGLAGLATKAGQYLDPTTNDPVQQAVGTARMGEGLASGTIQPRSAMENEYMDKSLSQNVFDTVEGATYLAGQIYAPITSAVFTVGSEVPVAKDILGGIAKGTQRAGEKLKYVPGYNQYRDTLPPEDQQRLDARAGNMLMAFAGSKNKGKITQNDMKGYIMDNFGSPGSLDRAFGQQLKAGYDATKGAIQKVGQLKPIEAIARKVTGTTDDQGKLFKAQEPRTNQLNKSVDYKNLRANSDIANEEIVKAGYTPTDTASRAQAHADTMKKLRTEEIESKIGTEYRVDLSPVADAIDDFIAKQETAGLIKNKAQLAELQAQADAFRRKGSVDGADGEFTKEMMNAQINNRGDSSIGDIYKNGLKEASRVLGKSLDDSFSAIPGEFSEAKRRFGALKATYQDIVKADIKAQKAKGLGLGETFGRIEGIGDILGAVGGLLTGKNPLPGLASGFGKIAVGKVLAKIKDKDFLIQEGFAGLSKKVLPTQKVSISNKGNAPALPLKDGATVFPGTKGQLGNKGPTPKSTPTVRETGVIGQPYKVPEPPKNKPAPQIGNGTKPKLGKETLEQDLVSEAKKYKSAEEFIKAEPVLKVKIESIKPTEGHTQENTLGTNGVARKEFRNKPILVEVDSKDPSKLYILDGNHRYFEQLSRGDKEVTVKVNGKGIDTDGYKARLKSIREQANKPSLGKPKVPGK